MNAPIIKGVGLYRAFGGINAISGVDVEIGARDLLCVIGPNGAGKSTLVGLMSGAIVPGAGELYLAGERMTGRAMYQYCRRGVVRKFQGTNVFQMMSVRENLEVAALGVSNRQAFSTRDLDGVLEQIGLAAQADMLAMHLPHGERQWLEIGMAMMCRPALLLLDEPAAGLSATDAQRLVHLIHRLREQCAVLAIEHDLRFVQSLNCETWVMHRGQIVRQGRYDDIAKDEEVRRIYLGQGASHAAH